MSAKTKSNSKIYSRKKFLRDGSLLLAGGISLKSCKEENQNQSANIISNKKYKWKMVTTWPPNFPVLGEGANLFAQWVKELSGGRMEIKVFGGGELVPPLEAFDAVSNGAVEIGSGCSYYWAGLSPAFQFFATVPFGMNSQQLNAWLIDGGGMQLWRDLYAKYNVIPFQAGNTGVQMGGWFNKEINDIEDFKGLKMRMPGLGGKVLEKVGGTAVLVPGSELYISLERGVIDATEWIGPYHDYLMGFHKIAKHYYSPGWHEPGTGLEHFVNKRTYEKLPLDLQAIIEVASQKLNSWVFYTFESKNRLYLNKLKDENVDFRLFSEEILNGLKEKTTEVVQDIISKDTESAKVYKEYSTFQKEIADWSNYSEKVYYRSF